MGKKNKLPDIYSKVYSSQLLMENRNLPPVPNFYDTTEKERQLLLDTPIYPNGYGEHDYSGDSGYFFGIANTGNGYFVGKRSDEDGHVLVTGTNGSGKSSILAMSTIETWRDPFVAIGDL